MKKLKSYCLHKDITGKVTMQEPDNGEDGLYYNANDADAVIEQLERENQELAAYVERIKHDREVVDLADNETDFNRSVNRLCNTIDNPPQTSLAEHDAQVIEKYKRSITEPNAIVHRYPVVDLSGFYLPPANGGPTFMHGNIEKAESGTPKTFVKCVIGRLLELLEEMEAADDGTIKQKGE